MDEKLITNLLEAITKVVKANGPYKEKVIQIKAACDEDDEGSLEEFLAWFDETD